MLNSPAMATLSFNTPCWLPPACIDWPATGFTAVVLAGRGELKLYGLLAPPPPPTPPTPIPPPGPVSGSLIDVVLLDRRPDAKLVKDLDSTFSTGTKSVIEVFFEVAGKSGTMSVQLLESLLASSKGAAGAGFKFESWPLNVSRLRTSSCSASSSERSSSLSAALYFAAPFFACSSLNVTEVFRPLALRGMARRSMGFPFF